MNLVHSTNAWHPCYVRSGPTHIPLYKCGGFVAACHFHCYVLPSDVEAPALVIVVIIYFTS